MKKATSKQHNAIIVVQVDCQRVLVPNRAHLADGRATDGEQPLGDRERAQQQRRSESSTAAAATTATHRRRVKLCNAAGVLQQLPFECIKCATGFNSSRCAAAQLATPRARLHVNPDRRP